MKSLGIVRKVDELGRIVIPKELRRTIGINDKDPLEIFTDGDAIILKPYRRDIELAEVIEQLTQVKTHANNSSVTEIVDKTIEFIKKA